MKDSIEVLGAAVSEHGWSQRVDRSGFVECCERRLTSFCPLLDDHHFGGFVGDLILEG